MLGVSLAAVGCSALRPLSATLRLGPLVCGRGCDVRWLGWRWLPTLGVFRLAAWLSRCLYAMLGVSLTAADCLARWLRCAALRCVALRCAALR